MSIAEIHGKMADIAKTEDMLTSDVFGALELLGDSYLRAWLKDAKGFGISCAKSEFVEQLPPVGAPPIFFFWPNLPASQPKVPGCQPDVLIFWGDLAVVIEVKYGAPKSGAGLEETNALKHAEELADRTLVDQLGRQWYAARALMRGNFVPDNCQVPKRAEVIFVTQDYGPPMSAIEESLISTGTKISDTGIKEQIRFYWTSFRKLYDTLEKQSPDRKKCQHEDIVISRLMELLKQKDLISFNGYPTITNTACIKNFRYVVQYFNQMTIPDNRFVLSLLVATYRIEGESYDPQ